MRGGGRKSFRTDATVCCAEAAPAFESLAIKLGEEGAKRFDEILEESRGDQAPENGDLEFAVKPKATRAGKSGIVISWTVTDGLAVALGAKKGTEVRRVQCVTTVNALATLVGVLQGIQLREEREADALKGQN